MLFFLKRAMEYHKNNYLITYIANATDFRVHVFDSTSGKAYETIKTNDEYRIYDDIGVNINKVIKAALDNDTYDIMHSSDIIITFHNNDIKFRLICENIRVESLDLSFYMLRSEMYKKLEVLRDDHRREISKLTTKLIMKDIENAKLMHYITLIYNRLHDSDKEIYIISNFTHCKRTDVSYKIYEKLFTINDRYHCKNTTADIYLHKAYIIGDIMDPKTPQIIATHKFECFELSLLTQAKILIFTDIHIANIDVLISAYDELHFYNVTFDNFDKFIELLGSFTNCKKLTVIGDNMNDIDFSFTRKCLLLEEICINNTVIDVRHIRKDIKIIRL